MNNFANNKYTKLLLTLSIYSSEKQVYSEYHTVKFKMKTGTDFFIKCWCCSYQKKLQYLESAAGINIYNHKRTGLLGYEDVSQTKNPIHHQFTGILGLIFTNSYLAMNYFKKL